VRKVQKNDELYKVLIRKGAEMTDFHALMNSLPAMVDPEEIKDLSGRIQFNLTGQGGGEWGVVLGDGKVSVSQGVMAEPELTVKTSTEVAEKLLRGNLNPMMAFMTGKIKISGDMALGMKLFNLLKQ
jgi:putative sterol carrier protein